MAILKKLRHHIPTIAIWFAFLGTIYYSFRTKCNGSLFLCGTSRSSSKNIDKYNPRLMADTLETVNNVDEVGEESLEEMIRALNFSLGEAISSNMDDNDILKALAEVNIEDDANGGWMHFKYKNKKLREEQLKMIKSIQKKESMCRRLPDVLIFGFEKCGTVTLLTFLNIHPDIVSTVNTENIAFFNYNSNESYRDIIQESSCTPNGKLKVSKMAVGGGQNPGRVFNIKPEMKLIAIVREPVERAMSHFIHNWKGEIKNRKITKAFGHEVVVQLNKTRPFSVSFRQSMYASRLNAWLRYFDVKDIHIVDGDNFIGNPAEELKGVEAFLGLRHFIDLKKHFVFKPKKKFYCLKGLAGNQCMPENKGRSHPRMEMAIRKRLQTFFRPLNERFFSLIGRNFSWNESYE